MLVFLLAVPKTQQKKGPRGAQTRLLHPQEFLELPVSMTSTLDPQRVEVTLAGSLHSVLTGQKYRQISRTVQAPHLVATKSHFCSMQFPAAGLQTSRALEVPGTGCYSERMGSLPPVTRPQAFLTSRLLTAFRGMSKATKASSHLFGEWKATSVKLNKN